jgi:hypothetical protein
MIKETNKKEFYNDFLKEYLSRGFGNMTKREMDVLVFHQLEQKEAFIGLTNYEVARKLKTTTSKVKNLKYEAKIRFDNENFEDDSYLRNELKNYFQSPILKLDENWLYIQVEDSMLMEAFKAKMKENGSLYDGSFNSELVKLSANDYKNLMIKLIYDGDKTLAKKAIGKKSSLKENEVEKYLKVIFDKAIKDGGSKGAKWIGLNTFNLLAGNFDKVIDAVEPLINLI